MIKRTLYFGNPAYLSLCNNQLVVKRAEDGDLPFPDRERNVRTIPIEDIGCYSGQPTDFDYVRSNRIYWRTMSP